MIKKKPRNHETERVQKETEREEEKENHQVVGNGVVVAAGLENG